MAFLTGLDLASLLANPRRSDAVPRRPEGASQIGVYSVRSSVLRTALESAEGEELGSGNQSIQPPANFEYGLGATDKRTPLHYKWLEVAKRPLRPAQRTKPPSQLESYDRAQVLGLNIAPVGGTPDKNNFRVPAVFQRKTSLSEIRSTILDTAVAESTQPKLQSPPADLTPATKVEQESAGGKEVTTADVNTQERVTSDSRASATAGAATENPNVQPRQTTDNRRKEKESPTPEAVKTRNAVPHKKPDVIPPASKVEQPTANVSEEKLPTSAVVSQDIPETQKKQSNSTILEEKQTASLDAEQKRPPAQVEPEVTSSQAKPMATDEVKQQVPSAQASPIPTQEVTKEVHTTQAKPIATQEVRKEVASAQVKPVATQEVKEEGPSAQAKPIGTEEGKKEVLSTQAKPTVTQEVKEEVPSVQAKPLAAQEVKNEMPSAQAKPLATQEMKKEVPSTQAKPTLTQEVKEEVPSSQAKPIAIQEVKKEVPSSQAKPIATREVKEEVPSVQAKPIATQEVKKEVPSAQAKPLVTEEVRKEVPSEQIKPLATQEVKKEMASPQVKPIATQEMQREVPSSQAKPIAKQEVKTEVPSAQAKPIDTQEVKASAQAKSTGAQQVKDRVPEAEAQPTTQTDGRTPAATPLEQQKSQQTTSPSSSQSEMKIVDTEMVEAVGPETKVEQVKVDSKESKTTSGSQMQSVDGTVDTRNGSTPAVAAAGTKGSNPSSPNFEVKSEAQPKTKEVRRKVQPASSRGRGRGDRTSIIDSVLNSVKSTKETPTAVPQPTSTKDQQAVGGKGSSPKAKPATIAGFSLQTLADSEALKKMTVKTLKEVLTKMNLNTSGKKSELISRVTKNVRALSADQ